MPLSPLSPTLGPLGGARGAVLAPPSSTLLAWWRADALALADGAAVTTWADSSGHGLILTQATPAAQPTYRTNQQNGQPAVMFAGAQVLAGAFSGLPIGSGVTVAVVGTNTAGTPNVALVGLATSSGTANTGPELFHESFAWKWRPAGSGSSDATWADNGPVVRAYVGAHTGTTQALYVNGSSVATNTATAAITAPTQLRLGRLFGDFYPLTGPIYEVLIYGSALSGGAFSDLHTYLLARYAL